MIVAASDFGCCDINQPRRRKRLSDGNLLRLPQSNLRFRRRAAATIRKTGLSQSSSTLNQINNQDDDRDYEQEMDQTAANMANEAKKPKHDQDDNYSPEHG
jgi:hypothetical protein